MFVFCCWLVGSSCTSTVLGDVEEKINSEKQCLVLDLYRSDYVPLSDAVEHDFLGSSSPFRARLEICGK
jgi:hypothetical protein